MRFGQVRSVPLKDVTITEPFFKRLQNLVRDVVLPYQWQALNDAIPGAEKSYCIRNLKIAAGKLQGERGGMVFQDSDLAKWLEAAAYQLQIEKDEELERHCDEVIDLIGEGQMADGYFNTYFQLVEPELKFKNLRDCHEMYVLGHFLEAAIAYREATGKDKLMRIMMRMVDLVASVIGPKEGQLHGYPGHEELELALVKLHRVTGEKKYLEFASYLIDERGKDPKFFVEERKLLQKAHFEGNDAQPMEYFQAHAPVREQTAVEGHSVRAMYLLCGMTDVAIETQDETLLAACKRLWESTVGRRMYVTGGIGSTAWGEAFSFDYHLPNDLCYTETCAAIGLVFFASRLLQLGADREIADVMERALYNGVLSGMSLDGRSFFYVNPLAVWPEEAHKVHDFEHVKTVRQPWFGCACCPPNLARLLTSLGGYCYGAEQDRLNVHLYMGGSVHTKLGNGAKAAFKVESGLPFAGDIRLVSECDGDFTLALRIPSWSADYTVTVNGETVFPMEEKGYILLKRNWKAGDAVALSLRMQPMRVYANAAVPHDAGQAAVQFGPLVYCAEQADNGEGLHNLILPYESELQPEWREELLGGVTVLKGWGYRRETVSGALYSFAKPVKKETELTLIPYYAWANRGEGEMRVWLREE